MACKHETDTLLYVYGELEQEKMASFLEHLETCTECQKMVRTCSLVSSALEEKEAPSFIIPSVTTTINTNKDSFNLWSYLGLFSHRFLPLALVGSLAIIIGFGALKYTELKTPSKDLSAKVNVAYQQDVFDDFENMDDDIATLQDEIDSLYYYMEQI